MKCYESGFKELMGFCFGNQKGHKPHSRSPVPKMSVLLFPKTLPGKRILFNPVVEIAWEQRYKYFFDSKDLTAKEEETRFSTISTD